MSGLTQPIKDRNDVKRLKEYYLVRKPNPRNYALIVTGLNCALRISDILSLRWREVYDFSENRFFDRIELIEQKTGKKQIIPLNENVIEALRRLFFEMRWVRPRDWIFEGNGGRHLSRSQAFRIVVTASEDLSLGPHISCHSLRKTFGYHAYKMGVSPVLLTELFNHSSFKITKRYLGLDQEEKDSVFLNINL